MSTFRRAHRVEDCFLRNYLYNRVSSCCFRGVQQSTNANKVPTSALKHLYPSSTAADSLAKAERLNGYSRKISVNPRSRTNVHLLVPLGHWH
ncbi:hypothetical protein DID88_007876 [Monilinia fructigena]|uniref:Uncharacterized protein n=1 Tax=Monilinia fructigena TaxID=38457 RepID=A0A395J488_9HELO|nr:hypothetical protein DID88_007876 [Monilinia fructigena]